MRLAVSPDPLGELERSPRHSSRNWGCLLIRDEGKERGKGKERDGKGKGGHYFRPWVRLQTMTSYAYCWDAGEHLWRHALLSNGLSASSFRRLKSAATTGRSTMDARRCLYVYATPLACSTSNYYVCRLFK